MNTCSALFPNDMEKALYANITEAVFYKNDTCEMQSNIDHQLIVSCAIITGIVCSIINPKIARVYAIEIIATIMWVIYANVYEDLFYAASFCILIIGVILASYKIDASSSDITICIATFLSILLANGMLLVISVCDRITQFVIFVFMPIILCTTMHSNSVYLFGIAIGCGTIGVFTEHWRLLVIMQCMILVMVFGILYLLCIIIAFKLVSIICDILKTVLLELFEYCYLKYPQVVDVIIVIIGFTLVMMLILLFAALATFNDTFDKRHM